MKKLEKIMVQNLEILTSKGYFHIFLLLSRNQERLCKNKHFKIMLDFWIGSIQKILIIILFICQMHKYRHTLVESLWIVIVSSGFNKQLLNNE